MAPAWYRRFFQWYPTRFRIEAERELTEMAAAEWRVARARGRLALAGTAVRLGVDHMGNLVRAWAAAFGRFRIGPVAGGLGHDLRFAWRALRRTPGFVVVATLIIAIGVGATTTILTVANGLLLRTPTGLRDPGELFTAHAVARDGSSFHSFSYPLFRELREARWSGVDLAAVRGFPASTVVAAEPRVLLGFGVTSAYFPILGTRAALGRLLGPGDDRGPDGPRVVVLGHSTWRDHFGSDSSIVGRSVTMNGQPFTVVGVAEPGFGGHVAAFDGAMWAPLEVTLVPSERDRLTDRRSVWLELLGRAHGTDRRVVAERLSAVSIRAGRADGLGWDRKVDVREYTPLPGAVLLPVIGFLGLLLVLGGTVMLISSSNIAGVMTARAMARARETAIRLTIGAPRGRLIRQLVVESLLVFLLGGAAGTVLAWVAADALAAVELPLPLPVRLDFSLDGGVLAASLSVAMVAGLLFGLLPAVQTTRPGLADALRDDGTVAGRSRVRLRSILVTAQVAASALLIVTAGLFSRALDRAKDVDIGLDPVGVNATSIDFSMLDYSDERVAGLAERLELRLAAIPGVTAVGAIDLTPLSLGNQGSMLSVDGREAVENVGFFATDFATVTPGYFATMGIPIVRGRGIAPGDRPGGPLAVVVNEALAERVWPGEDPVGRALRWGRISDGRPAVVAGVARTGKYRSLGESPRAMLYLAVAQIPPKSISFMVRHRPGVEVSRAVLGAVGEIDPDLAPTSNGDYEQMVAINLLPNRLAAFLASAFGAVGLALATVGLYGVLSYLVVRRRREIGIRMALGAPAARVRGMVLREGLRLTGIGLVLGTGAALLLGLAIRGLLFGVPALDPASVAGAAVVMLVVAGIASDLPARRAAATAPAEVLRND